MQAIKYVYMQNFMFVGVSVIEILEFNRKKKNMAKLWNTILQVLHRFYKILLIFSQYQHVLHFGNGKSQIEWNMKMKIEISICTGLMLNDHSNPYNNYYRKYYRTFW